MTDDPYNFTVPPVDKFTKKKYGKHYDLVSDYAEYDDSDGYFLLYRVSNFFEKKLNKYKSVKKYGFRNVWRADNHIIKMYENKTLFEDSVEIQNYLYDKDPDLVVPIVEIWDNKYEWFVVMKYGGKTIGKIYPDDDGIPDIPCDITRKMKDAKNRLRKLGYIHEDLHLENFVIDKYNIVRIIDYDAIVPIEDAEEDEEYEWEIFCRGDNSSDEEESSG